jgi:hypothetical protein
MIADIPLDFTDTASMCGDRIDPPRAVISGIHLHSEHERGSVTIMPHFPKKQRQN